MKTGKFTVIAIASILGAIALTGCGRAVETSKDAGKVQPAAQTVQTTEAVQTDNAAVTTEAAVTAPAKSTEQNANAAALSNNDVISYNADTNTASYTQQPAAQAPVQQAAPAYKAASSAEQAAADNAIAYSGGNGMIVSCDFVNYDYDKLQYAFKVGVRSMSDANAPVSYFMAGTDYAEKC